MCGIAGYYGNPLTPHVLHAVSNSIRHRGPEDEGFYKTVTGDGELSLVHRRLCIIDLSSGGHQPMLSGDGSAVIAFNGEIYNFLELRGRLEKEGFRFRSRSDTEVILHAYAKWGPECVTRLHGMFSFALWDACERQLLLARDRLGKKPLYYRDSGGSFAFGSEIKAILAFDGATPDIDYSALDDYLTYLYVPYPKTIFQGIRQLPPATRMLVRFRGGDVLTERTRYWDPMSWTAVFPGRRALKEQVEQLFSDAVESRLISDVPLGVLLSGGLDSSSIAAMVARKSKSAVRTFSIGFSQHASYDEIPYAKVVSDHFGTEHEVLQADPACWQHLTSLIYHFDQPFGNPTAVLTYILSKLTKDYVTVALAGDGGDELFGGYPRYTGAYLSGVIRCLPGFIRTGLLPRLGAAMSDDSEGRHQFRRVREFLEASGQPPIEMYLRWIGYFSAAERRALYTPETRAAIGHYDSGQFLRGLFNESEGLDPINRLAYVDIKSFLCCNVLEYADRMSMAHALELRAPLTDHRLVELSLRIPYNLKFRHGQSKWIFRQAMKPYLPVSVLNKKKVGFNPPLASWLNGELRHLPGLLLTTERIRQKGFFAPGKVQEMIGEHVSKRRDHSLHLWALMVFDLWFEMYIEGRTPEILQEQVGRAVGSAALRS